MFRITALISLLANAVGEKKETEATDEGKKPEIKITLYEGGSR